MYVFSDEYITAHPTILRAFVTAIKEAAAFAREAPAEAKQIVSEATGLNADLLAVPVYPKDNCIEMEAAVEWLNVLQDGGVISRGSVHSIDWVTNDHNAVGCGLPRWTGGMQ